MADENTAPEEKSPAPVGRQAKMLRDALALIAEGVAPAEAVERACAGTYASPGARRLTAKILAALVARATTPDHF